MEKLTIKQLSAYLPYGLNTIYNLSSVINLGEGARDEVRNKLLTEDNVKFVLLYCKPILRPLSDLSNDKKTVLNMSAINYGAGLGYHTKETIDNRIRTNTLLYNDAVVLFENHYDVFGLIDKGLAIDINCLNKIEGWIK